MTGVTSCQKHVIIADWFPHWFPSPARTATASRFWELGMTWAPCSKLGLENPLNYKAVPVSYQCYIMLYHAISIIGSPQTSHFVLVLMIAGRLMKAKVFSPEEAGFPSDSNPSWTGSTQDQSCSASVSRGETIITPAQKQMGRCQTCVVPIAW